MVCLNVVEALVMLWDLVCLVEQSPSLSTDCNMGTWFAWL